MKKQILALAMVLLATLSIKAEEAMYNDVLYNIDTETLTAEVAINLKVEGEIVIPSEIQVGEKTFRVTAIGEKAFKGCKSLMSIFIPSSVLKIGDGAFEDCHIEKSHINNNTSFNLSKYGMKIINK